MEQEIEIIKRDDEGVETTGRQRDGANQKIRHIAKLPHQLQIV